jgi:hypothetical protein
VTKSSNHTLSLLILLQLLISRGCLLPTTDSVLILVPSVVLRCTPLYSDYLDSLTTSNSLIPLAESESYVTTDGQSARLSWNKAPIWGLRPDFYYCQTVTVLLMWGAVSDERTGLSFTTAAGPRQHSHSRVRVPWDSRPYFTVSDSRLPFPSPPTTRRATVEVFDPASTRD